MIRRGYPQEFTHLTTPQANHSSNLKPPKNKVCHSVVFYSAVLEGTLKLTRQDLSSHLGPFYVICHKTVALISPTRPQLQLSCTEIWDLSPGLLLYKPKQQTNPLTPSSVSVRCIFTALCSPLLSTCMPEKLQV